MSNIEKELETLGQILNLYQDENILEVKIELFEGIDIEQVDSVCKNAIEPYFTKLNDFRLEGVFLKISYSR